jgi:biopolymer transport protein ExbB/TolQ
MPVRTARRIAAENTAVIGISKTIGSAIIGLIVMLIGTGILAQMSLYVRVATLSELVTTNTQTLKQHLADSVSERQYQKDQLLVSDQIRMMASKDEFRSLQKQLDAQTDVLRKIEDKLDRVRR